MEESVFFLGVMSICSLSQKFYRIKLFIIQLKSSLYINDFNIWEEILKSVTNTPVLFTQEIAIASYKSKEEKC